MKESTMLELALAEMTFSSPSHHIKPERRGQKTDIWKNLFESGSKLTDSAVQQSAFLTNGEVWWNSCNPGHPGRLLLLLCAIDPSPVLS